MHPDAGESRPAGGGALDQAAPLEGLQGLGVGSRVAGTGPACELEERLALSPMKGHSEGRRVPVGGQVIGSYVGTEARDVATRRAAGLLLSDAGLVIEACAEVLAGGAPARLELDLGLDEADYTGDLSRLVAARPLLTEHRIGPFESAFDELAAELARRLGPDAGKEARHA